MRRRSMPPSTTNCSHVRFCSRSEATPMAMIWRQLMVRYRSPTRLPTPWRARCASKSWLRSIAEAASRRRYRRMLIQLRGRYPGIEVVAEKLSMHPRALRRRLEVEGTAYRDILAEVRMRLAIEYLRKTKMTNEEIANRLGYSDAANFRHAFLRWTGKSRVDFLVFAWYLARRNEMKVEPGRRDHFLLPCPGRQQHGCCKAGFFYFAWGCFPRFLCPGCFSQRFEASCMQQSPRARMIAVQQASSRASHRRLCPKLTGQAGHSHLSRVGGARYRDLKSSCTRGLIRT